MADDSRACSIVGCIRTEIVSRDMCELHYRRVIRHGNAGPAGRMCNRCRKEFFVLRKGKYLYCPDCSLCSVEGCSQPRDRGDLCQRHRNIKYKYGDPGHSGVATRVRRHAVGHVRGNRGNGGYLEVKLPSHPMANSCGYILQHRLVMEQTLGRMLTSDENVHHINGDRSDNRPDNLELWNTSQPCGQRVPDKIAWAVELLQIYAPERLALPAPV